MFFIGVSVSIISDSSSSFLKPIPSQAGHAPYGELNEKNLGDSSPIEYPHSGQEKCSEKRVSSPVSWSSIITRPLAILRASSIESDSLWEFSAVFFTLSTTAYTLCFLFFSSSGISSILYNSPSIFARRNPSFSNPSMSFL